MQKKVFELIYSETKLPAKTDDALQAKDFQYLQQKVVYLYLI
jgi:hypothetical protein